MVSPYADLSQYDAATFLSAQKDMPSHAREAGELLKVLANEDRLLLLCQLTMGSYHVGELEVLLGIRQPTLSQQLRVLRNKGIVKATRRGKFIFYSLLDEKAIRVMRTLWEIYCAPGHAERKV